MTAVQRALADLPGPRLGSRAWFPDLDAEVYLNHAAISPPSTLVRGVIAQVLDDYAHRGVGAVMDWWTERQDLRVGLAELVGAEADDIGFVPNTTHGVLAIALCLDWQAGDRVLLFQGEFPTNITPWQRAARTFGLELCWEELHGFDDGSGDGLARVEAQLQRGLRLVAVSGVQFQTGLRMPIAELAELCHVHGAELFVDGIQAAGALPLELRSWGVDYLAAGSHKWLMGTEGAAFLYVHPHRIGQLVPRIAGWLSHEDALSFLFEGPGHMRYDRAIRRKADFLEVGAPNTIGFAALHAGIEPLRRLGVGAVHLHVQRLLDVFEEGMLARGFQSARASDPAARSNILALRPPPGVEGPALVQALGAAGVSAALPDGWLRFSPHWCNDLDQTAPLLAAVDRALKAS